MNTFKTTRSNNNIYPQKSSTRLDKKNISVLVYVMQFMFNYGRWNDRKQYQDGLVVSPSNTV